MKDRNDKQWRSQGAVAVVAPQDWTATKIIVVSIVHTTSKSHFFFTQEAFCGLGYAENVFATGALHKILLGAHDARAGQPGTQ